MTHNKLHFNFFNIKQHPNYLKYIISINTIAVKVKIHVEFRYLLVWISDIVCLLRKARLHIFDSEWNLFIGMADVPFNEVVTYYSVTT